MTVRSYGCTRRHMSVLCSSNVQLKFLLCVNKEDRKWQFGSSNQECHSQLHPLPAPDTSDGRRGHGSDSSFSLSPSVSFSFLFCLFYRTFHFSASYAMHNSQGEDRMMYGRHEPEQWWHIFWTQIKHEACLVRLPWHPVSKCLPCLSEAEKQIFPSSSGQTCQDIIMKDTKVSVYGKTELSKINLISLSGMSFMMRNSKLCAENGVGYSVTGCIHFNRFYSWVLSHKNIPYVWNKSAK